jgi:hypothetical protein
MMVHLSIKSVFLWFASYTGVREGRLVLQVLTINVSRRDLNINLIYDIVRAVIDISNDFHWCSQAIGLASVAAIIGEVQLQTENFLTAVLGS